MPDYFDDIGVPYPPVFRDWQDRDRRVATTSDVAGIGVEMLHRTTPDGLAVWRRVTLTEDDATLMAASLLQRAGHRKLARRVAGKVARNAS
jgi:hypothetical protein